MKFTPGDEKESMAARGLTFDMVLAAPVIDFIDNPAREDQRILIVEIDGYAVAAPCKPLDGDDEWLIVTAWFSRKFTQHYLEK